VDNETYICSECGDEEGMVDAGYIKPNVAILLRELDLLSHIYLENSDQKKGNHIVIHDTKDYGVRCWVDDCLLDYEQSQAIYNISLYGFNVGYGGSGPAQLALAILLHLTDEETALKRYQQFERAFVAKWELGNDYYVQVNLWVRWKALMERLEQKLD
jgi:hypothetical protein